MKKVLSFVLSALMLLSLCACGTKEPAVTPAVEPAEEATVENSWGTVTRYYDSLENADGETMFRVSIHPFLFEQAVLEELFADEADAIDKFNEDAMRTRSSLEGTYGNNLKIEVEQKSITEYNPEDVEKINKYLYDNCEYPANYVSELHVFEVGVTVKGDVSEETQSGEIVVAKIQGNWYIVTFTGLYGNESIKAILSQY
ncbi:MAG: hypothetical protein IKB50_00715 [Clostridia bacterium]|nr:hypothetical protein [Clostridia bacterium]